MTVFREQVVGVGCDGAVRKDIIIGVCRNDPELKRWGNAQEVSAVSSARSISRASLRHRAGPLSRVRTSSYSSRIGVDTAQVNRPATQVSKMGWNGWCCARACITVSVSMQTIILCAILRAPRG